MYDQSKFKLGLFVLFALAVFLGAVTMFGMLDRFKKKAHLTTLVSESVQGLSAGCPVKYQGVPIGVVQDIAIYTSGQMIRIDMEIDLSKFVVQNPSEAPETVGEEAFYAYLEEKIRQGLRCKLEPDGITGKKYIEMDFVQNPEPPPPTADFKQYGVAHYVPSVPSLISDLRSSVTSIFAKMESIDYKGIADRVAHLLDSADELISSPKIRHTIDTLDSTATELNASAQSLRKDLSAERIDTLFKNLNAAAQSVNELSQSIDAEVKRSEIFQIAADIRSTLANFRRNSDSFNETMSKLNNGIDALVELIQYLDSDPSSLIRGKSD